MPADDLAAALAKLGRTPAPLGSLRALAEAQPREEPPPEPDESTPAAERWARIREKAASLGGDNANLGNLLWVERQCVDAGLHAMHPLWIRHFADFYASGAFEDIGRFGLRAAKSDSTCRAITAEVLLMQRTIDRTVNARCPVMSATIAEANDRFVNIVEILRACGITDHEGRDDPEPWKFKKSGGGMAPIVIQLHDSQCHVVKFQVGAANEANAVGFTGIAGFGDELVLWGKATGTNSAANVLRLLRSRFATQPQAKLHLMSASYERESEHARLIKEALESPHPDRYVARIGADGSRADYEARLRLAGKIGSKDPILVGPPLPPDSPDIPSWITNPIIPIEEAYRKSASVAEMFGLYGGRVGGAMGESVGRVTALPGRYASTDPRADAPRGGRYRP